MMSADAHGFFRGKQLVVFGAGYVGQAVVNQALARGMKVTALTRNTAKARQLASDGVDVVIADLASDEWHSRINAPMDFALNCVSSGGGGIEGYRRSYLAGMQSIARWAYGTGAVGTLLYTSSTSVYPQDGGVTVDETASTEATDGAGRILLDTEEILKTAQCDRWFVLRLAGIYGPGRHHLLDQIKADGGEISGRGEHRLNLIHRDDIASAIWSAFAAPTDMAGQTFNVSDNHAVTKTEVMAWLAQRLGVPAPRFTGEAVPGRRRAITPDRVISNAKIKRLLGWQPKYDSFREGYEAILGA